MNPSPGLFGRIVLRVKILGQVLLIGLIAGLPAFSQDDAPVDYDTARFDKNATALRIDEEVTLDGLLNEAAWDIALPVSDFYQQNPRPGTLALNQVEARFLYDDDNLYVGIILFDANPGNLVINDLTEDFGFNQDSIGFMLDTLRDYRSGFMFFVNAAGARRDGQISNDGQSDNFDWDGAWDVETSQNDLGWVAEFRIPFKTLRFSNSESQEWGLNFDRKVRYQFEDSVWSPIPVRWRASRMSMAGTLGGLEGIRQGRNLTVKPFGVAGFTQSRQGGDPFGDWDTDHNYDGGLDLKYGLTQSLTLDATYRTDFAQVEVDQQQVNLTRFNLFFPEKREFFLENAGTFTFGPRRGRDLIPFFSRRIGLSDQGTPIPIVGGARVSGQVGRYDVGFLTMKTESTTTTPSNLYTVGRVKQNLLTNSWIGGLLTNRDSTVAGDYNRLYGADAYFQFFNRLEFDSHIIKTDTPGMEEDDWARKLGVGWRDDELIIEATYDAVEKNFNPEVGFVRRPDVTQYNGNISWNPRLESSSLIRNLIFGTSLNYYEGATTEQIETRTERLDLGVRFEDSSSINFSIEQNLERLTEVFHIRRDVGIAEGDYNYRRYRVSASTDPARSIAGGGNFEWGEFWDGESESFGGNVSFRPNYNLSLRVDYSRNQVDLSNDSFTTDLVGMRFVYGFSPRAFFNAFIQYNADRNQISSNLRFNIIHRPLSDLFVVFNDIRSTDNGQVMDRELIVKFTNLFNF